MTEATYERKGEQARLDAIRDLCDLAHDDPDHYSAQLLLARATAIDVLIREALHTCHRPALSGPLTTCGLCGRPNGGTPDLDRADHIMDRGRVALGRPLSLMDAVAGNVRPAPSAAPTPDADELVAWLEGAEA